MGMSDYGGSGGGGGFEGDNETITSQTKKLYQVASLIGSFFYAFFFVLYDFNKLASLCAKWLLVFEKNKMNNK